jgi:hypothetical protein
VCAGRTGRLAAGADRGEATRARAGVALV